MAPFRIRFRAFQNLLIGAAVLAALADTAVSRAQRPKRGSLDDNPFDLRESATAGDDDEPAPFDNEQEPPASATQQLTPELDDAGLNDIAFVDARTGWAVGDRGVIWHTDDGGQNWQLQQSGTAARLTCVQFLDAERGWAAGYEVWPVLGQTRGVLLHTPDGGRHWHHDRNTLLPSLRAVKFVTPRQGWAVGASSALYPGGILWTEDGGQSWSAVPSTALGAWCGGDWIDGRLGVVVGQAHGAASVDRRAWRATAGCIDPATNVALSMRAVRLLPSGEAWLVGDGGQVLASRDGGRSCQPACEALADVLPHVDFAAVAVQGSHVWAAGAPGSVVLHSADRGQTWALHETGQSLPITSMKFVDAENGWAVGAMGTILGTRDGGRTWQALRAAGRQAAWSGVFASGADAPWEVFAQLGAAQGYRGVLHTITRAESLAAEPPADGEPIPASTNITSDSEELDRLAFAATLTGASAVRAGRCAAATAADFDSFADWLAVQLRTWRPQLVITYGREARRDPLRRSLHAATLEAVARAADPQALPHATNQLALAYWEVPRVVGCSTGDDRAALRLASTEIPARLGRSLGDVADEARSLIGTAEPSPELWGISVDKPAGGELGRDLFSGLPIAPGSEARRSLPAADAQAAAQMQRHGQQQRNVKAIFARSLDTSSGALRGTELLTQLGELTRGWPADATARLLERLARETAARGGWDRAAELWQLLVEQHPNHPLVGAALVALLHHDASSEIAWRMRYDKPNGDALVAARTPATVDPELAEIAAANAQGSSGEVALASAQSPEPPSRARALRWARQLEQQSGALYSEPFVRFPLANAERAQVAGQAASDVRAVERYFGTLRQTRPHDTWWACAAGEAWLAEPAAHCPKPLALCARTDARPRLDGEFDDACWQQAEPYVIETMVNDQTATSARWRVAYDNEFLYLAVECRRLKGSAVAPRGRPPRAHDDARHSPDRIEVSLDLDRDYVTAYRLAVDELGRSADDCCGDTSWNPTWYIASAGDETMWTSEAAIAWSQLAPRSPQPGDTWAMGVTRVIAGQSQHAWSDTFTSRAPTTAGSAWGFLQFR